MFDIEISLKPNKKNLDFLDQMLNTLHMVNVGVFAKEEKRKWKRNRHTKIATPSEKDTLIGVAHRHEFGIGVPKRSFLRATYHKNLAHIRIRLMVGFQKAVTQRKPSYVSAGFIVAGRYAARQVQRKFFRGDFKPLSPKTRPDDEFRQPLWDTAQLAHSINYEYLKMKKSN